MYIFYCVNCGLGGIYIPLNKNLYWLDFCWTNYLLFFLLAPPVKPLNQWVLQKYDEEWVIYAVCGEITCMIYYEKICYPACGYDEIVQSGRGNFIFSNHHICARNPFL